MRFFSDLNQLHTAATTPSRSVSIEFLIASIVLSSKKKRCMSSATGGAYSANPAQVAFSKKTNG